MSKPLYPAPGRGHQRVALLGQEAERHLGSADVVGTGLEGATRPLKKKRQISTKTTPVFERVQGKKGEGGRGKKKRRANALHLGTPKHGQRTATRTGAIAPRTATHNGDDIGKLEHRRRGGVGAVSQRRVALVHDAVLSAERDRGIVVHPDPQAALVHRGPHLGPLVGRSVGWLVGWLGGWLVGWVVGGVK